VNYHSVLVLSNPFISYKCFSLIFLSGVRLYATHNSDSHKIQISLFENYGTPVIYVYLSFKN